jgi:hypothetical protein
MTFISRVEDVFEIEGRGTILTPGFSDAALKDRNIVIRRGDSVELRKPDGSALRITITEIEAMHGARGCFYPIILPKHLSKPDIPIGTEVWLCGTIST